jgi:hypothetical protein
LEDCSLGDLRGANPSQFARVIVDDTLTNGYVAGLVFVVPLGDLVENRGLISLLLVTAGLALLGLPWRLPAPVSSQPGSLSVPPPPAPR